MKDSNQIQEAADNHAEHQEGIWQHHYDSFIAGAEYALSHTEAKPYGYVFNHRFYETLEELSGYGMFEGNTPIAVYTKPQLTDINVGQSEAEKQLGEEWVSVETALPEDLQPCNFVVHSRDEHYHGKVYGGTYIGNPQSEYRKHEFAMPGIVFRASHWMPSPPPPRHSAVTDCKND